MKRLCPVFLLLFLLQNCDSKPEPLKFETTSIDTSYDADISTTLDKATGNNPLSDLINTKMEASIIATLSDDTKKTDLESVLDDFNSEYLSFKKQFPEASSPVWELHIETENIYQSDEVVTLAISTYEFKGGAHGNDHISFLNLNAKTGSVLEQDDIINNLNDFKTLAKNHFVKSLNLENETLKMEDFFFGKPFQLPQNIGFSDDGLVLLYNVYEVASYDQGYTEFVIPYNDLNDDLKIK